MDEESNETDLFYGISDAILNITQESDLQQKVILEADSAIKELQQIQSSKQLLKIQSQQIPLKQKLCILKNRLSNSHEQAKPAIISRIKTIQDSLNALESDELFLLKCKQEPLKDSFKSSERDNLIRTGKITPFAQINDSSATYQEIPQHSQPDSDFESTPDIPHSDYSEIHSEIHSENENKSSRQDRYLDDGDESSYQNRLMKWAQNRYEKRKSLSKNTHNIHDEFDPQQEMFKPSLSKPDVNYGIGFNLPGEIHAKLFEYQRTCIRWLWELYSQEVGGIIGDEMGLGKTVQMISFLAGLHFSKKLNGPVLIVCPATLMKQWVQEFHEWWPCMRVCVLHSSGSGMSFIKRENEFDDSSEEESYSKNSKQKTKNKNPQVKALLEYVSKNGHVIVTTYQGLRIHQDDFLAIDWAYAVLDEGHKIRNPDADITITAKQIRTPHRMILSGTPIQNNLIELWALYDFVFPGRLGTLPVFQSQFAIPISLGGYANASVVQVQTAYKCATVLRDLISPYLLRRMKSDVAATLPKKSEQVLFCKLTSKQQSEYRKFLSSEDVSSILNGKKHALFGIDILRKICNHPDILKLKDSEDASPIRNYGDPEKSGKLKVVKALLNMWSQQKKNPNKILLFCQTRQMQDILEGMVRKSGYSYLRMDGSTPIKDRSALVDRFNETPDIFVFLLTTKVGGLGINLTGANRVILYDPDWNPASDAQARERAWRLGQKRDVTIYRLMTSGTIEEKIYHRQIFKEFLSKKILQDPMQRRFFKSNQLHDLFTLGNLDKDSNETAELFGEDVEVKNDASKSTDINSTPEKKKRKIIDGHKDDLSSFVELEKVQDFGPVEKQEQSTIEDDDSRILNALFSSNGVQSAVKHDAIVGAARPEISIIEKEASKVAQEAALALKASRKRVRELKKVYVPTWTGKNGHAGAPTRPKFGKSVPSFGRSDSEIPSSGIVESLNLNSSKSNTSVPAKLISDLRNFLASKPEMKAQSSELVEEFRSLVDSEGMPLFRKLLNQIAVFIKKENEKGVWKLKDEFIF